MDQRIKERRGGAGRRGGGKLLGTMRDRILAVATAMFLVLCLLMGGASRASDLPLLLLRPLAVLLIGLVLGMTSPRVFLPYRLPLALLGLLALTMMVQLVPLPPALWMRLPMSAVYAPSLKMTGLDSLWRPLSIAPDLTVNSLLALLPPVAVLLALAGLSSRFYRQLLTPVLVAMVGSALLGLGQFAGGNNSALYLWADRSEAVADGLFANRNHQAVFLACGLALLGAWISTPDERKGRRAGVGPRFAAGALMGLLFLVTVIATGSRTGTMLALLALAFSYWTLIRSAVMAQVLEPLPRATRLALRWSWMIVPLLLAVMVLSGRAVTFERLVSTDVGEDQRFRSWPVMVDMLRHVFPFGSGFGTFDQLFRTFEPARNLHFGFFNHAHNDFFELLLNSGLAGALVILFATIWWVMASVRVFRARTSRYNVLARSAAFALFLLAAASLVDYPVRTPLLSCLVAILAFWLAGGSRQNTCAGPTGVSTQE